MQAVQSLLTQQLAEMKGKLPESGGVNPNQFKGLPKSIAASLGFSLQREQAGFQPVGSSVHQLSQSCYDIAQQMPAGSFVSTGHGEVLSKMDYLQTAAYLSPATKYVWQALAESLGENETAKVGQQRFNKSECLSRSLPPPIRVVLPGQAQQGQANSQ